MEQLGLLNESVCKKPIHYRKEPISDNYIVEQRPFARGKFATVRRCRHKESGVEYAAKSMRKRRRACDVRHEIVHEAHVLEMSSSQPHIVQLHEVYETPSEIVLVLELVEGGELQRVLDDEEVVGEREAVKLLTQILAGVSFLHDHNIAHLDLKPQNLLLTKAFPDGEVKLCDFGISRLITKGIEIREIVGTPDYVAPEVLHYEPISLATDMWSIGILTYVLLSGHSPFGGDTKQETFCNITRGTLEFPNDLFGNISNNAKDFICKLLVRNPRERMSAQDCFKHPWLSGTDVGINGIQLTLTPDKSITASKVDSSPNTKEKESPSRIQNQSKHPELISPAINRQSPQLCKANGTTEKSTTDSPHNKFNGTTEKSTTTPPCNKFNGTTEKSTTTPPCNKFNGTTEKSTISPACNKFNGTTEKSSTNPPCIKFNGTTEKPPISSVCNKFNGTFEKSPISPACNKFNGTTEKSTTSPACNNFNGITEKPATTPSSYRFNGIDSERKNSLPLCNKSNAFNLEPRRSSLYYSKFNSFNQGSKKSTLFCSNSNSNDKDPKGNSPYCNKSAIADMESKNNTSTSNTSNGIDPESKKSVHGGSFCNKSNVMEQESKNGSTTSTTTTRSVDTMVARFEGLSMSKRIVFSEEIIVDERVGMVY